MNIVVETYFHRPSWNYSRAISLLVDNPIIKRSLQRLREDFEFFLRKKLQQRLTLLEKQARVCKYLYYRLIIIYYRLYDTLEQPTKD